jgi:hypothetical protein
MFIFSEEEDRAKAIDVRERHPNYFHLTQRLCVFQQIKALGEGVGVLMCMREVGASGL